MTTIQRPRERARDTGPPSRRRHGLAARLALHPTRTLLAVLGLIVLAGLVGGPVTGQLDGDGSFVPARADSVLTTSQIEQATGREPAPGVVVLVSIPGGLTADADRVRQVADRLKQVHGISVVAAPQPGNPATESLIAYSGRAAIVTGTLSASADPDQVATDALAALASRPGVRVGGDVVAAQQVSSQVVQDLGRGELFAVPILLVLSLLVFRGFAALLAVFVGASTVLGTFLVLAGVDRFYSVSIFASSLVSGLGLGLAIAYSLVLVTRYREAARQGATVAAIVTTMRTAGRRVAVSAGTVAAALSTLTIFPLGFARSMGIAGAIVAVLGGLSALVVTPAFLGLWGHRVAEPSRFGKGRERGTWYVVASAVRRRPGTIALNAGVLMLLLAAPAMRVHWTAGDATSIPVGQSSRTVADTLVNDFPGAGGTTTVIALRLATGLTTDVAQSAVSTYSSAADALPGVLIPGSPRQLDARTWQLTLSTRGEAGDQSAQDLVTDLRGLDLPDGLQAKVGGPAAAFVDQQDAIGSELLLGLALLVGLTMLVMWLLTGSVVVPVTAVLTNALTVGAALGLLTVIYQDGRLTGLLGYTPHGGVEPTDFLVAAAVAFALSTHYGITMLGRIKELRDEGAGEHEAVTVGLQQTGRVVIASALLLGISISAFCASAISSIQQVGMAAAFAVLIDACVVRSLLVPSLMGLLGRWNWWSPRPLRRLHSQIRVSW